jgi:hypothetical protein
MQHREETKEKGGKKEKETKIT